MYVKYIYTYKQCICYSPIINHWPVS